MFLLDQSDRYALGASGICILFAWTLSSLKGAPLLWVAEFTPVSLVCLACLACGVGLRATGSRQALSLFLIYFAHLGVITMSMTILNASLFPISNPLIDPLLFRIDALIGYDWLGFVTFFSNYPEVSRLLKFVYGSHLIQIVLVILALSLNKNRERLQGMLATAVTATLLTIAFWFFFPSFGPSAFLSVPSEIAAAASLDVAEHAAFLMRSADEGIPVLQSHNLDGMIAFPSFHIVMAVLATWFAWKTKLFPVLCVLNLAMIPATLLHGAHHIVDLFGGISFFLIALIFSRHMISEKAATAITAPTRIQAGSTNPVPVPINAKRTRSSKLID